MANIAFLSTAHIHTKGFIQNILDANDGRKVAFIWDDVPGRGKNYAEMAGALFESDLAKVLSNPGVDGFIICAENTRHLALLKKALPVGKPVFCEKPLVTNDEDLHEVRTLLKSSSSPLFCGYFNPFGGDQQAIARLIADNKLGKVTRVRFRNAHHAAYGRWFDNPDLAWFTDPDLAGGGALMDMGTHAIHALRTLFGPVKRVWAQIGNHAGIYPAVDDYGIVQLEFVSGIIGTVEAAWTQTGGLGGLEVTGSEASVWRNDSGYVFGKPGTSAVPVEDAPAKPTRVDRLVAVIRNEVPQQELQDDLAAVCDSVSIMSAAYRSAQSGVWEKVD